MKCVKCGHNDESRGYQWPNAILHRKLYFNGQGAITCAPHDRTDEHLDVTCGVCGYTWAEPCADAGAPG